MAMRPRPLKEYSGLHGGTKPDICLHYSQSGLGSWWHHALSTFKWPSFKYLVRSLATLRYQTTRRYCYVNRTILIRQSLPFNRIAGGFFYRLGEDSRFRNVMKFVNPL